MRTKDTIKLSVRVEIVNVDIKNDNVEIAVEIQKMVLQKHKVKITYSIILKILKIILMFHQTILLGQIIYQQMLFI